MMGKDGKLLLERAHSRFKMFLVISVATLIFMAVDFVLIREVMRSVSRGRTDFTLAGLVCIFGLIALVLVGVMIHRLLGLFNPSPSLALMQRQLVLGGEMDLQWRLRGRAEKLSHMTITLVGQETATYRSGTTNAMSTEVFLAVVLMDSTDPREMKRGGLRLQIPAHTMHSFASAHNTVDWSLNVKGKIPRWPDIDDDFPILIEAPAAEVHRG